MTAASEQARALVSAADHELAAELAERSGELLLALRQSGARDPDALRQQGDRRSHELLVTELAARRPADAVLSEEGADGSSRLDARRVWIVDPLDGTREFGEPERVDWAVHVALVIDGFPVAGAVALPALGEVWSTAAPPPQAPAAIVPRPPAATPPRLAVSRTRPGWSAGLVGRALSAELVPLGSAGFKALAVVRGRADIYAHSSGQYEWDSAAPVAVALAHGLHASRLDGSPLAYNNASPYLPDLLIAHPDWARPALNAVAGGDPSAGACPTPGT
ncbi:MAG TPA: 3'(2'),5'-bisphosphate nucleotidase CysQ [Streptosporangiaceae bacterium]|nr:3'(2'),5'-bisphosphate nucleotidase CysQ [Streptosporangiaceae bacterium]